MERAESEYEKTRWLRKKGWLSASEGWIAEPGKKRVRPEIV